MYIIYYVYKLITIKYVLHILKYMTFHNWKLSNFRVVHGDNDA